MGCGRNTMIVEGSVSGSLRWKGDFTVGRQNILACVLPGFRCLCSESLLGRSAARKAPLIFSLVICKCPCHVRSQQD